MKTTTLGNLAVLTLTNPAEAARQLLAFRIGREVLWLAFFLAVVLNGLVQFGFEHMLPTPDGLSLPEREPIFMSLIRSSVYMLFSIVAFLAVGRLLGGQGTFVEIMTLTVWLQYLQTAASVAALILAIIAPMLMVLFLFVIALVSLYVTLHFLNEAHKFGTLWKSFGVIVLSALVAAPFVLALTPNAPV
ncbi:Yip1 domain protein [Ruegeria denitrificans]|uniref:Yip1 domain protein n=1 Tax=Ruegeria denitrificans TaxID=1715692 RepID=A0A0P1I7A1_9RHOB|nr:YIP1 family protein [Ruegeria denitrificans]CUJ95075.1 Yip1 domain protein [Ruegeria denitrificans]